MPYHLECTDCHHKYSRSYLALSKRCPRCRSKDVATSHPSQKTGKIVFGAGIVSFVLLSLDLGGLNKGGPVYTVIGWFTNSIFGENAIFYFIITFLIALIASLAIVAGIGIAFGKRVD